MLRIAHDFAGEVRCRSTIEQATSPENLLCRESHKTVGSGRRCCCFLRVRWWLPPAEAAAWWRRRWRRQRRRRWRRRRWRRRRRRRLAADHIRRRVESDPSHVVGQSSSVARPGSHPMRGHVRRPSVQRSRARRPSVHRPQSIPSDRCPIITATTIIGITAIGTTTIAGTHPWHYGPVGLVVGRFCDRRRRFGIRRGAGVTGRTTTPTTPTVVVVGEHDGRLLAADRRCADGAERRTRRWPTNRPEQSLDAAHDAFAHGDYATAMTQVNQAIAQKPNDTVPHEFRALVLFATKRYKEAAAAIYAVLSVGPGWDWATMSGFYPDVNVYTAQLRALEQYRDDQPEVARGRASCLAYHYMSCGHRDAAIARTEASRAS